MIQLMKLQEHSPKANMAGKIAYTPQENMINIYKLKIKMILL